MTAPLARDQARQRSGAAERMARTRARRQAGVRHVGVDVDAVVEDALLRRGFLAAQQADDRAAFAAQRAAFAAAAQRALEEWAELQLTPAASPSDDVARNAMDFRSVPWSRGDDVGGG